MLKALPFLLLVALTSCSGGGSQNAALPPTGAAGVSPNTNSAPPPSYTMTALPLFIARAINNKGAIAGEAETGGPATYLNGSLVVFPRHADHQLGAEAFDINDNGEAVGFDTSGVQEGSSCIISSYLAVFHTDGTVTYVGPQPQGEASLTRVNNNGVATGVFRANAISFPPLTTVFQPSSGGNAIGLGINDSGTIVGRYAISSQDIGSKPFVAPAQPNCCGTAQFGEAVDINNYGHIVGDSFVSDPNTAKPWLYANGITTTLPLLPGDSLGVPRAINDQDEIVGVEGIGPEKPNNNLHAVVWMNGKVYDLNSVVTNLPNGALITDAFDVNNSGKIVVFVLDAPSTAYLLTPQ